VVDFVDIGSWPVFNVADSALWVGIGLLLIASRRQGRDGQSAAATPSPSAAP
jgi:signal peptidase II